MSNRITIELCAEDRARLDRLAEALERYPHKCESCAQGVADTVAAVVKATQETNTAEKAQEQPTEPTKEDAPATATATAPATEEMPAAADLPWEEPAPTVTLAQIQQKVVQLAAGADAVKKAAVRAIIHDYAEKVSDLPEDKWSEVWKRLAALEG